MLDNHAAKRLLRQIRRLAFLKASPHWLLLAPAVCLLAGVALWLAVLSKVDADRTALQRSSLNEAFSLAHAYAQYVANAIEQVDQIALRVKYDWERSHGKLDLAELSESGVLRASKTIFVLVVNRDGALVTTTRVGEPRPLVNLADTDYFRFHQNDKSNDLLIGRPGIGRVTGSTVIHFTRRLETPDGAFDGVVIISVTPDYLTSFYTGSTPGTTGLLAVVGNDGSLRAARMADASQEPPSPAFRSIPLFDTLQGSAVLEGKQWFTDERARYVGWETLKAYPLVVLGGIAEQELLAPHEKVWAVYRQEAMAGSVALLLLALVGVGWSARLAWRKHYAEEVRRAYRIATEAANEGFYMLHAVRDDGDVITDFEVVDCNERGASFYGLPKARVLGTRLSARYAPPLFAALMVRLREAMASGYREYERALPPDGPVRLGWTRTKLVRAGDGLAVTVQDITERRRAEEALRESEAKLRGLYKMPHVGLLLTDMNYRYLEFNEAFRNITGYSDDELRHLDSWKLTPLQYEAADVRQLELAKRTGRFGPYEKAYVRKDGSLIPVQLNGALFTAGDGTQYLWTIVEDITERKHLERAVLEAADRERRSLGADLHDGLGQELTGISLMIGALARSAKTGGAPEAERLTQLGARIGQAIGACRTIAHGLSPLSYASGGLVGALQEMARPQEGRGYGPQVHFQATTAAPLRLSPDALDHLYRIAQEAVANAQRHAKAQRIDVTLDIQPAMVRLAIEDDGIGLARPAAEATGMGQRIMQFRTAMIGARLSIGAGHRGGTQVAVQCPQPP